PLVVGPAGGRDLVAAGDPGTPWLSQPIAASPITLAGDPQVADLTIEFAKNTTAGQFTCRLYSPHPIAASKGPHDVDLGQDAKTFARSLVDEVRLQNDSALLEMLMRGVGSLVADKLPGAAKDALYEVAKIVAPS